CARPSRPRHEREHAPVAYVDSPRREGRRLAPCWRRRSIPCRGLEGNKQVLSAPPGTRIVLTIGPNQVAIARFRRVALRCGPLSAHNLHGDNPMQRITRIGWIGVISLGLSLIGCGKKAPDEEKPDAPQVPPVQPVAQLKPEGAPPEGIEVPPIPVPGDKADTGTAKDGKAADDAALQANYDAAVAQALDHLADRQTAKALEALQAAQSFRDTEFIRTEIAKLKVRIDQDAAARKTSNEIEAILDQGKGVEAAKLAQSAL